MKTDRICGRCPGYQCRESEKHPQKPGNKCGFDGLPCRWSVEGPFNNPFREPKEREE